MRQLQRDANNPLLRPAPEATWESLAVFNPCVIKVDSGYHMLFRAEGPVERTDAPAFVQSSIGHATSVDGVHFSGRRQILRPENAWERFGCEDPRLSRVGDRFYIFYTALSTYPFEASGIRVGVAVTRDFEHFEKHLVTPFNAKAMALFPERIDGRLAAILTVHTDMPPSKVAIAWFDREEQIWSEAYWQEWYRQLDRHVIPLLRGPGDHVETGAPPILTEDGWLLLHCYIQNYRERWRTFGIEALLVDTHDPQRVIQRTCEPLLTPQRDYEINGRVANVIFPSGAVINGGDLVVYYGAADTYCCAARMPIAHLQDELRTNHASEFAPSRRVRQGFRRFEGNPILTPRTEFAWESKATFNPAAVRLADKVHLLYRAMSADGTSSLGYASSEDGLHFDDRPPFPVYQPRAIFEHKRREGNSGCEDPRLTIMDDRIYLFYTAYDGFTPRVAYSAISVDEFLKRDWNWQPPVAITPPNIDDKDGCLLPKRIDGKYVVFHRAGEDICINFVDDLAFGKDDWVDEPSAKIKPRKEYWDNRKFGIAAPPIETPLGWLLFFHRVTKPVPVYKVEAMLLDIADPRRVIAETGATLLEPETSDECRGQTPNVVFPCGAVLLDEQVYLYYGGGDSVCCVARMPLQEIFKRLGI
jgi:beta-1,2-mannobiose phosphorylase / 1,2-beta-oligomannan phosphorylase